MIIYDRPAESIGHKTIYIYIYMYEIIILQISIYFILHGISLINRKVSEEKFKPESDSLASKQLNPIWIGRVWIFRNCLQQIS